MSTAQWASYTKRELLLSFFCCCLFLHTLLFDFCFIFVSLQTWIFSFADKKMLVASCQMHGYCFNQGKQPQPLALHPAQVLRDISGRNWRFEVQQRPWEMEDGQSGSPCHGSKLSRCSCSGEEVRKRKGTISIHISIYTHLRSEFIRDALDALHDLTLIAIDIRGLWVGLFKTPEVQFNL